MLKIIDYDIIHANSINHLVRMVGTAIMNKWEPLGGICYDGSLYCQAMVKTNTES